MNASSLVSAIVVNWNGARDLERELPSLVGQTYKPLEILVVDNGSTDDSEAVAAKFFGVRWVPLGRNIGLAPAYNRGAEVAKGNLLLFLNNDMRFKEDFVERLADVQAGSQDVFAVDALQYEWSGGRVAHAATYLGPAFERGELSVPIAPGLFIHQRLTDRPVPVTMASGANLMARRELFTLLGGFDEKFILGGEDLDICLRAWNRGWKTIFVPSAVCWHDVSCASRSTTAGRRLRFQGTIRLRWRLAIKFFPIRLLLDVAMRMAAGVVADLLRGRWWNALDRLTAALDAAADIRGLWKGRIPLKETKGFFPGKHPTERCKCHT